MAIKKVSEIGSDVIRTKTSEVINMGSKKLMHIITDMTDTMRHEGLVGIAAPQIGVGSRIFITEIRKTKHEQIVKILIHYVYL